MPNDDHLLVKIRNYVFLVIGILAVGIAIGVEMMVNPPETPPFDLLPILLRGLAVTIELTLLGAALGLYHPAGTSMVATVVERRGMAFAAHGIAGNIGVGAVPAIAIGISIATDWRMAYIVLGIAALGVALVVRTLAPSKEEVIDASQRASRSRVMAATGLARPRSTPPASTRSGSACLS